MAAKSTIEVRVTGQMDPSETSTYTGPVSSSPPTVVKEALTVGAADLQMDTLFIEDSADAGQLAASGTRSLDLQTLLDPFGDALVLTDAAYLFIQHKSGSTGVLEVQPNAANGFTNFLGAGSSMTIQPNSFFLMFIPDANALVVSGTNKVLDLVETGTANAVDYRVEIWGRK